MEVLLRHSPFLSTRELKLLGLGRRMNQTVGSLSFVPPTRQFEGDLVVSNPNSRASHKRQVLVPLTSPVLFHPKATDGCPDALRRVVTTIGLEDHAGREIR